MAPRIIGFFYLFGTVYTSVSVVAALLTSVPVSPLIFSLCVLLNGLDTVCTVIQIRFYDPMNPYQWTHSAITFVGFCVGLILLGLGQVQ